jgi:hypothetical protein
MRFKGTWTRFKRVRVGMAIGADRLTLCVPGNGATPIDLHTIELSGSPESRREQIRHVLQAISTEQQNPVLDLFVAVMPDACQCKFVQLPALGEAELRSLVTGAPDRFFLLTDREVSIGAKQSRKEARTLIAAGSNDVLDPLRQACATNWKIQAIVPAETSWAAASIAANPNASAAAIRTRDACVVMRLENRMLTAMRRIPSTADVATIAAAVDVASEAVLVLSEAPETIAARYAVRSSGPFIRNNTEERSARRGAFRSAAFSILAAVVIGLTAASLETRNQRSDAAIIANHRKVHAADVQAASKEIAEFKTIEEKIRAIDRLSQQSVHPADLLVQLGDFLPENAYATQLTVTADSATVEIAGPAAATTLSSLRRSRTFAPAKVNGSIRLLNGTADSTVLETIRIHLAYSSKPRSAK